MKNRELSQTGLWLNKEKQESFFLMPDDVIHVKMNSTFTEVEVQKSCESWNSKLPLSSQHQSQSRTLPPELQRPESRLMWVSHMKKPLIYSSRTKSIFLKNWRFRSKFFWKTEYKMEICRKHEHNIFINYIKPNTIYN